MLSHNPDVPSYDSPAYRAYLIGVSGRVEGVEEIAAANDAEAEAIARCLLDGRDIELWDRDRLVVGFPVRRE